MQEYQSIIMMFYVPLYALMSKVVFFNLKKFNYTEHLVIFMYILSHVTIISAIITLFAALFGLTIGTLAIVFTLPYQIIYSAYCLKRLFGLSLKGIILRTILFLVLLGILMLIIVIIGAIVAIVFKDSEFMRSLIETQKAAKEVSGN
jgi:hypothetical protein